MNYSSLGAWGFAAAHEYIMRNFDSESKVFKIQLLQLTEYVPNIILQTNFRNISTNTIISEY